ncbi:hypothetical protein [Streptomyces sp. NPDC001604]|uniref:hypothetical protein n=1 Tax=Streptomyces sp. NPDC001604 TaxID=3364593 RepID=UPI0036B41090
MNFQVKAGTRDMTNVVSDAKAGTWHIYASAFGTCELRTTVEATADDYYRCAFPNTTTTPAINAAGDYVDVTYNVPGGVIPNSPTRDARRHRHQDPSTAARTGPGSAMVDAG